jgi:hypothetical protein
MIDMINKQQQELIQYKSFIDGTCEAVFFDDPVMQKKA